MPASIDVVLEQPSHGEGVRVIGGQRAPLEYVLTVTNSGDAPSGPIVVTDTEHKLTTLVPDSPSCDATPGCTVVVAATPINQSVGREITWSIDDVAPRASVELSFAATVNDSMPRCTSITSRPFVTNVNTPNCTTPTCARDVVTNPAEAFAFEPGPAGFWPRNTVWYSGPGPTLEAAGWVPNDPDAELSYEWECYPPELCEVGSTTGPSTTTLFRWHDDDYIDWFLTLTVTATRGDDTLVGINHMQFSLEYRPCTENDESGGPRVPCPWDMTDGPRWP